MRGFLHQMDFCSMGGPGDRHPCCAQGSDWGDSLSGTEERPWNRTHEGRPEGGFDLTSRSALIVCSRHEGPAGGAPPKEDRTVPDYYELRRYQLQNGPQGKALDDFLREVAIPALNGHGVHPVGVFTGLLGDVNPAVYTLLRHTSLEAIVAVRAWLAADQEFQRAGAAFLDVPADRPAFVRTESSLLVAFDGMPELETPPGAATSAPRIFELRRYESHSEPALQRKIEMFNTREIAIFRRTGLDPGLLRGDPDRAADAELDVPAHLRRYGGT